MSVASDKGTREAATDRHSRWSFLSVSFSLPHPHSPRVRPKAARSAGETRGEWRMSGKGRGESRAVGSESRPLPSPIDPPSALVSRSPGFRSPLTSSVPHPTHTHPTPWPFPRYACDRFAPAYGVNEWRKIGRRNHVISRNFRSRFVPFALRLSSTHSTYR